MASWIKWSKNERPGPPRVTLYTDDVVTVASTSANAVIRQLTNEFAREMNEKADNLDRAIEDRRSESMKELDSVIAEEPEEHDAVQETGGEISTGANTREITEEPDDKPRDEK